MHTQLCGDILPDGVKNTAYDSWWSADDATAKVGVQQI